MANRNTDSLFTAELALLDVLGDGVGCLLGGHLHLGLGHLGDLGQQVVQAVPSLQGNVMPWGHGLVAVPVKAVVMKKRGRVAKANPCGEWGVMNGLNDLGSN